MKNLKILLTLLVALTSFNAYALPIAATNGSDFTITYDSIGGTPATDIDGLSASVRYYNFNFSFDGTNTEVMFYFDVSNTSTNPILTSRVSTLGFTTDPDIIYDDSSVSGVYDNIVDGGNVPNQGAVEFCFNDPNGNGGGSCAGGGNGGVDMTEGMLSGGAMLAFLGDISTINFSQFTVRYQSVSCATNYSGNCPGSASGNGTDDVPVPAVLGIMSIGLLGMAFSSGLRRRKIS